MSKLINVADDVYEMLRQMKAQQSYSEVIRTALQKQGNKEALLACAGKGGIDKNALREIKKEWKKWTDKYA